MKEIKELNITQLRNYSCEYLKKLFSEYSPIRLIFFRETIGYILSEKDYSEIQKEDK